MQPPPDSWSYDLQEAADQDKKIDTLKEERAKIVRQLESLGTGTSANPSRGGVPPVGGSDISNGTGAILSPPKPTIVNLPGADSEEEEFIEIKARALFDYEATNETELVPRPTCSSGVSQD